MNSLYSYLESVHMQTDGNSLESVVFLNGTMYNRVYQPLPPGVKFGKNHECYYNAYRLAQEKGWQYVEGFGYKYIALEHAWVIDNNGIVVDNTWKVPGDYYMGIAFDMKFIHEVQVETGLYGVMQLHSQVFRNRYFSK